MKKTTKNLALALGLLTTAIASHAQSSAMPSTAPMSPPLGLLGTQYTEFNLGAQDIRHISTDGYGLGIAANTAVIPGKVDAGALYRYNWIGGSFRGHANTVGAYATAYAPMQGVKPFVGAGLGYQWTSVRFGGSDDQALWNATAGVEIPAGPVTLTPRVNYDDDFQGTGKSGQAWTYSLEANYWLDSKCAVFASVGYSEVRHSKFDTWNYVVGLRSRF
jgi:hypothetical protein